MKGSLARPEEAVSIDEGILKGEIVGTLDDFLEAEEPDDAHDDVAGEEHEQQQPIGVEQSLAQPQGTDAADDWQKTALTDQWRRRETNPPLPFD